MRRILHWFLACLPWIILLSFRSTSFFHPFDCSFHRISSRFFRRIIFLSFRRNFEQSRTYPPPSFLFPFFQQSDFSTSTKIIIYIYKKNEAISDSRDSIPLWDRFQVDRSEMWRDISTRLNKIISFPFSIFHATHHFIAISLFYQNRTLYYIFGSVFDPPPSPRTNIDHYIYLYISRSFLRLIIFETPEIQRRRLRFRLHN